MRTFSKRSGTSGPQDASVGADGAAVEGSTKAQQPKYGDRYAHDTVTHAPEALQREPDRTGCNVDISPISS